MGANNTPIPDLIELDGITVYTTYSATGDTGGTILGVVDNATYSDDENNNSSTQITELNETYDADAGYLTIDGVNYVIQLVTPTNNSNGNVSYTTGSGDSGTIWGDGDESDITFIVAEPLGGGSTRYFALMDDSVGDVVGLNTLTTGDLDYDPAGDDVMIDVDQNNTLTAVCFVTGTMIDTPDGPRPVEALSSGDLVSTVDRGAQPVLWTDRRYFSADDLRRDPRQRPVRIARGALGEGLPTDDLFVSPQHRVLLRSKLAARMFGSSEVLVPAVKLLSLEGVAQIEAPFGVEYHHFLCAHHELVYAEGMPAESLLRGEEALHHVRHAMRRLMRLIPRGGVGPVRPIVQRRGAIEALIRRAVKTRQPLLQG